MPTSGQAEQAMPRRGMISPTQSVPEITAMWGSEYNNPCHTTIVAGVNHAMCNSQRALHRRSDYTVSIVVITR